MTQQYRLASMAARLFSTGMSHHKPLRHILSICLSAVNSSPHPGIAPQSLNSRAQPLCRLGSVWLWQGPPDSQSFRLPQISCFTLSLKCFSSDSDYYPRVGIAPLLQFPHTLRAGPVLLTLLFFLPSSFFSWVSCGSVYSFLRVRYSCPLSAGILHVLLCLKVYSWCYPWRELYSTSAYSSAILFSLVILFLFYVFTWPVIFSVTEMNYFLEIRYFTKGYYH